MRRAPASTSFLLFFTKDFSKDLRHRHNVSDTYSPRWELDINWKPVFLAGLTKGAGGNCLLSYSGFQNVVRSMIIIDIVQFYLLE